MEYISLAEVISAIEDKVEPSLEASSHIVARTADEDGSPGANIDRLRASLLNGLFKLSYKKSFAAGALDACLASASADCLNWFDCGATGWVKPSKKAKDNASKLLVHMANYYSRLLQGCSAGLLDGYPQSHCFPDHAGPFAHPEDAARTHEICFDRVELIAFLIRQGVPNSLEIPSESPPVVPNIGGNVHSTKSRKSNILDELIDKTIDKVGMKNNQAVFNCLREMARDGISPFTGLVEEDKLFYTKNNSVVDALTSKKLGDRLRRRRAKDSTQ